jgi:TolB-like protein
VGTCILLSMCLACAGLQLAPGTNKVRSAAQDIATQLSANLPPGEKPVIAVLDFVGPHERYTAFGNTMSESLITELFKTRRFEKIVERARMKDVLAQQKLEQSWHYNKATIAELGRKIGAGAIVVATVNQIGKSVRLNARLINSETGEVLSVAEMQVSLSDDLNALLKQELSASLAITLVEDDGTGSFGNLRSRAYLTIGSNQTREVVGGTAVIDSVPYGPHMLVVSAPGYETATEHVFISANQSRMITLVAQQANLTLQLTPTNATVLIDGIRKRPSEEGIVSVSLKKGPHSLLVSSGEKYYPDDRRIELIDNMAMPIVLHKVGAGDAVTAQSLLLRRLASLKQHDPPFEIKLWTDRQDYTMGDSIAFNFRSDRDCYLTLIDIATSGNITILFPNRYHPQNFIRAGVTYRVPAEDYGFEFQVTGPRGIERVKAIATLQDQPIFEHDFSQTAFRSIARTRDVQVVNAGMDKIQNGWTEAESSIRVR